MKNWRKMGNKVLYEAPDNQFLYLTGRQFKALQITGQKSQGSNLLLSLIKRI